MESRFRGRGQYVMTSFIALRCRLKRSIAHLRQVEGWLPYGRSSIASRMRHAACTIRSCTTAPCGRVPQGNACLSVSPSLLCCPDSRMMRLEDSRRVNLVKELRGLRNSVENSSTMLRCRSRRPRGRFPLVGREDAAHGYRRHMLWGSPDHGEAETHIHECARRKRTERAGCGTVQASGITWSGKMPARAARASQSNPFSSPWSVTRTVLRPATRPPTISV